MRISRWETILSDVDGLFTVDFSFKGDILKLYVEDRAETQYLVSLKAPKYIRLVDEEYLTKYWSQKGKSGWTSIVEDDGELQRYMQQWFEKPLRRYMVATYDYCLEIISDKEPSIAAIGKQKRPTKH